MPKPRIITDEALIENYLYMFELPAWQAFKETLQKRRDSLSRIETIEPGETLETRQSRLAEVSVTLGFEDMVRALVAEEEQV